MRRSSGRGSCKINGVLPWRVTLHRSTSSNFSATCSLHTSTSVPKIEHAGAFGRSSKPDINELSSVTK
jgi:hypothetical protein